MRNEERQCDAAAHRLLRQENPERRHEEQERNTIGNIKFHIIVVVLSIVT